MLKRKIRAKTLLAATVALILAATITASAAVITGPTVINTPGVYVIDQDFVNSNATKFIVINSSDVVIQGNGHLIDGLSVSGTYGIYINSTKTLTNITIENLKLEDWYTGIYLNNTDDSTILNCNSSNNENTGITLKDSSNIEVKNCTTNNDTDYGGVYLRNTSNCKLEDGTANISFYGIYTEYDKNTTISNCTANNNNYYGIYLYYDKNTTISSGTTNNNNYYGIYLYYSENDKIIGSTINNNNYYGIYLYADKNTTISNCTTNNNAIGIYPYYSKNDIIENCTIDNNYKWGGIYVYETTNLNLRNCKIENNTGKNYAGVYLCYSNSNTIYNNYITNNSYYGIYIYDSSSNLIYNNYFNNTNNTGFTKTYANKWNITKTPGKNIVGGPYIAGNYWATPSGTGFSQVTPDKNGDGICDSPYSITTNNIDYLPLSLNYSVVIPPVPENPTSTLVVLGFAVIVAAMAVEVGRRLKF